MTTPFADRTALVTGAGRGIGRAIALQLADAGASVALLARSADELDETAEQIRSRGGRTTVVRADLADPERVADHVAAAEAELGPIEILINNAGVGWPLGPTTSVALDGWATAVAINLTSAVAAELAVLPGMLELGWGRIVNVSSIAVARPTAMIGTNAYVTSKTALEAHTVNLAAEIAGTGVTVNAFRPGSVDTRMQEEIRGAAPGVVGAALQERFVRSHAAGDLLTAEDSARALLGHLRALDNGAVWDLSA